jgi:hypothetical protein
MASQLPSNANPMIFPSPSITGLPLFPPVMSLSLKKATGSLPLSTQWFKNSGAISGATSTTLTIVSASFSDVASYFASVNNAGGTVTTNNVTLNVTGSLPPGP